MQQISVRKCSKYQFGNAGNISQQMHSQQMQYIPVSKRSKYQSANAANIGQ
jgi:hypothetical protein